MLLHTNTSPVDDRSSKIIDKMCFPDKLHIILYCIIFIYK